MDSAPRRALDQLRTLRDSDALGAVCERLGVRLLVAFGSAVHPTAQPHDLDLAVLLDDDGDLVTVVTELMQLLSCNDVDVLDLARADPVARFEALGAGELLHEDEPHTFAEQQIAAVLRYADTQWLRDLRLQALTR